MEREPAGRGFFLFVCRLSLSPVGFGLVLLLETMPFCPASRPQVIRLEENEYIQKLGFIGAYRKYRKHPVTM